MGDRIEYPKKLTFGSEYDMDLFEGIVKAHRADNNHKSDGDFIMYLLKEKYMPTDEKAREFCARLYRRNKDKTGSFKEKAFTVLEDVFVHLMGNFDEPQYSRILPLVVFMASIVDKSWVLSENDIMEEQRKDYEALINTLSDLCNEVTKKAKEDSERLGESIRDDSAYIRQNLKLGELYVWRLLDDFAERYTSLSKHLSYYRALAYFCRILSAKPDISEDGRYHLINIIKNISKYW